MASVPPGCAQAPCWAQLPAALHTSPPPAAPRRWMANFLVEGTAAREKSGAGAGGGSGAGAGRGRGQGWRGGGSN